MVSCIDNIDDVRKALSLNRSAATAVIYFPCWARKRSKTEDHPEVPTVQYKLWKETLDLLAKVEKRHELVFTSEDNTPMHSATKDLFYLQWQRMPVPCPITLAKFRSIGASALKTDKHYREYVELFLGHSAASIADKHYAAEAWQPFYKATDYIRQNLKAGE